MAELDFDPTKLKAEDITLYNNLVAKRKAQGAPFGGPYAALMNHPKLCQKIEALGYFLKFEGHLPRDVYQFIVLSVAKETNSEFEWEDHLPHAIRAGLPDPVIKELSLHGINGKEFPAPYKQAAEVLKATQAFKSIPGKIQEEAIALYGMQGFLEVVVLSGFYQMFSAINCGFDIRP